MRHRFHALCPYFAMFPETFAEKWIERVSRTGDVILDPFSGRGTAPFQALLMGRRSVGVDINPVAYCVTRAKTNAPFPAAVRRRLTILERGFRARSWIPKVDALPEFFSIAYQRRTCAQLLYLRQALRWRETRVDCMIAALVLGSLHGESNQSPSFLSAQMPHTISTKPAYSVRYWKKHGISAPERDVFGFLRGRITYRYESPPPSERAVVLETDMRELPRLRAKLPKRLGVVITSPPYLNVTAYEEDQWLRLWFLGRPARPTYGKISRDDRIESPDRYWNLIGDVWRVFGQVLSPNAHIVMRLGAKRLWPDQIVDGLIATSVLSGRRVRLAHREESAIRRRQTDAFRPGSKGCMVEVDCHFRMR